MKRLNKSLIMATSGLSIFLLFACNIFNTSDSDDGPKLEILPGKIVYSAERDGETELYIIDQKGTRQLTSSGNGDNFASDPSFSPDGEKIIYSTSVKGGFTRNIFMIQTDGSDRTALTDIKGEAIRGENPVFSPDGKKVAFNRAEQYEPIYANNDIYVLDLDSKEVQKITQNTAHDTNPSWSPDGDKLVFSSGRGYEEADTLRFRKDLYVINADGTNLQRITQTGYAREPVWKPKSDSITFRSTNSSPGIFNVDIDSKNIFKVREDLQRIQLHPNRWSNDGSKLLITTLKLDPPKNNAIYVVEQNKKEMEEIYSESSKGSKNPILIGLDWFEPSNKNLK